MREIPTNRIQGILAKYLPERYVRNFINNQENGLQYGREIFKVQQDLLGYEHGQFNGKNMDILQWATLLQNITMVKNTAEYMDVFAKHIEVSRNSTSQLISGLDSISSANSFLLAGYFDSALQNPKEDLFGFHSLTAALFAQKILREELGDEGAKRAAWAILFHHYARPDQIPLDPMARLLRDSVTLYDLDEISMHKSITKNIVNGKKTFFNPKIPQKLRMEMLEGLKTPDEQELDDPDLKFDALHFALKTLFIDTNPKMFALPELAGHYLRNKDIFTRLLNRVILSAEQHNRISESQIDNVELLKTLLRYASKSSNCSGNAETIAKGAQVIDHYLRSTLDNIDAALKSDPYSTDNLFIKARTLYAMEQPQASRDAYAKAYLQQGVEFFDQGNSEDAYNYFDISEKYKPDYYPTLCSKAAMFLKFNKYNQALKYYEKAEAAAKEQKLPMLEVAEILIAKSIIFLEHLNSPYMAFAIINGALKMLSEEIKLDDTTAIKNNEEQNRLPKEALMILRAAEYNMSN